MESLPKCLGRAARQCVKCSSKSVTRHGSKIKPRRSGKNGCSPIRKKGDKIQPESYRAIALLSISGKVFYRVILNRMQDKIGHNLSKSKFGFSRGKGTIFVVRQIIEKAKEHKVALNFNSIDSKAAFDTIWRTALWEMMREIGVSDKPVSLIEALYKNTQCAMLLDIQVTEWFEVTAGVRQGCLLSSILFNIFLEFVMNDIKSLNAEPSLNNNLKLDIRYADDTTLLTVMFEKLTI